MFQKTLNVDTLDVEQQLPGLSKERARGAVPMNIPGLAAPSLPGIGGNYAQEEANGYSSLPVPKIPDSFLSLKKPVPLMPPPPPPPVSIKK